MSEVLTLLRPRLWSFKNGVISKRLRGRKIRWIFFGTLGLGFWAGAFVIIYRVLIYFQGVEELGNILAYKLLSMALITFFSLLIFSAILTSLSKLYLSKDLPLVHAMPVSTEKIFLARWMESTFDSSWMVLVYSLPIFLSYGIVYKAGIFYYTVVSLNLLPFCLIASSLSVLVVMLVAFLLPAGRIRSIVFFLSFLLFILLIISFRLMRPERFVRPESFASLMLYLKNLEAPHSPLLPTTWFFDCLRSALSRSGEGILLNTSLSWSGAAMLLWLATSVSRSLYFRGLSKAQTAPKRFFPRSGSTEVLPRLFLRFLSGPARAFVIKEIKTFFRDQTQWSQIFLLVALIVIYLYNFSVLPLQKSWIKLEYLQNTLSFLNVGLVAFVLTAVSARFVFPAVSLEGDAFWIVKSSPVSIRSFLWIKFFVYFFPLLVLSELLIIATNIILHVTPFMMVISVLTILLMVPGIVSLGLGLGAIYPDFHSENPAQSVTSFGGLVYMTLSMAFIGAVIVLEAGPVYSMLVAAFQKGRATGLQWFWLLGSFTLVMGLCVMALLVPMRLGEQRISRFELGRRG